MEVSLEELVGLISPQSTTASESTLANALGLRPGFKVVIRTVTYHYTGKVRHVCEGRVELSQACWIAISGRWSDFLRTGDAEEVEAYPDNVNISLASIVDWSLINDLPSCTK